MRSRRLSGFVIAFFLLALSCAWFLARNPSVHTGRESIPPASPEAVQKNETFGGGTGIAKTPLSESPADSPEVLTVGWLTLRMAFEDNPRTPLTPAQRRAVVQDIQMVYSYMEESEFYKIEPRSFRIAGNEVIADQKLHFTSGARMWPEAHQGQFGFVFGKRGGYSLVIPNELINSYLDAFAFQASHRQAFDALELLLPKLASKNADQWAGVKAADVIWTPPAEKITSEIIEHIFREIQKISIRRPSILDFGKAIETDERSWQLFPEDVLYRKGFSLSEDKKTAIT